MSTGDLFPPIVPFETGWLDVDELHTLFWEQSGRSDGPAVLFLHGGPGAGSAPIHRRFFDPEHYRIVLFDQRGSGRSRPLGEVENNSPGLLVEDIERLRRHLGIERWHVFGGSWGSTLALAYAQSHPDRCLSLILRGIFLMREPEIDWFLYGMRTIFPDSWEAFAGFVPEAERGDLLGAYRSRLFGDDPAVRLQAARAWSRYEGACSTLIPSPDLVNMAGDDRYALGLARIEAHFFHAHRFEPETRLLDEVGRIRHVPTIIVQGRYDVVCPMRTAFELHSAWPEADFQVIDAAGHSAMEPGIRSALVAAMERVKGIS